MPNLLSPPNPSSIWKKLISEATDKAGMIDKDSIVLNDLKYIFKELHKSYVSLFRTLRQIGICNFYNFEKNMH